MCSTFYCIYIVYKCIYIFCITCCILYCNFYWNFTCFFYIYWFWMYFFFLSSLSGLWQMVWDSGSTRKWDSAADDHTFGVVHSNMGAAAKQWLISHFHAITITTSIIIANNNNIHELWIARPFVCALWHFDALICQIYVCVCACSVLDESDRATLAPIGSL